VEKARYKRANEEVEDNANDDGSYDDADNFTHQVDQRWQEGGKDHKKSDHHN
jgi:hypothetical protein